MSAKTRVFFAFILFYTSTAIAITIDGNIIVDHLIVRDYPVVITYSK